MAPKDQFSIAQWEQINTRLDQIIKKLETKPSFGSVLSLLDNADILQLFKISAKTAQRWRDEHQIAYSQIGNKIYYKIEDIQAFLDRNYHKVQISNGDSKRK